MSSELELAPDGRLLRHTECVPRRVGDALRSLPVVPRRIADGFGVRETIARFELLTARRPARIPPPLWYVEVLRETSVSEASAAAGGALDEGALQAGFVSMVASNLGKGMLLGCAIYAAAKVAAFALRHH